MDEKMMDWKHLVRAEPAEQRPYTPEQRLCSAVLERAVRDLCRFGADDAPARRSAFQWLTDGSTEPFSFRFICDALDFPYKDVRAKILTITEY